MIDNRKVIIFTDWYEPGYKAGGPIQSVKNIVKYFNADYQFFIVTSDRDFGDSKPYDGLVADRWHPLSESVSIFYNSPGKLSIPLLKKMFQQLNPSVVYLNSMFSPKFSVLPLFVLKTINYSQRIVLAPRGMLRGSALTNKKWKKSIFLRLISYTKVYKKVVFHATDEQELLDIRKHFGRKADAILADNIPNVFNDWKRREKKAGELKIIFLSRIHPIKNLLFALEVCKRLNGISQIQFDIYGSIEDDGYYLKCFEAARDLEGSISISFLGPLAHSDVFETLQDYHLFFLPTLGENFGHAIFEALSAGCPVLISNQTPWKDLEKFNAGWAFPLQNIDKFVSTIHEIAGMEEQEFSKTSASAFEYAKMYLVKSNIREKYLKLFS